MKPTVRYHSTDLAGFSVPVIELTGRPDGPRLVVLAGVHGCEYAPMAAVRRWTRELADRDMRGSVVAVPVLNLPAFRARSPFVTPGDGKNLNRCFPGDPADTLSDRLAHATFTRLITGASALLDVHAGDMGEALEPLRSTMPVPARQPRSGWPPPTGSATSSARSPARTARSAGRPARPRPARASWRSSPRQAGAAWSSRRPWTRTSAG